MAESYVGLSTTVWAIVGASESVFLGVLCLVLHIQQHQVCVPNAEKLFSGCAPRGASNDAWRCCARHVFQTKRPCVVLTFDSGRQTYVDCNRRSRGTLFSMKYGNIMIILISISLLK